jgi:hypothetical protein
MLAAFSLSGAYAQKNSILLFGNSNGGGGTESSPLQETGSSGMSVNAGVGYQFSNHFTAGVLGSYSYSTRDTKQLIAPASTTHNTSHVYGLGLFGRYTHYLGDRFFVYMQGDANYSKSFGRATSSQSPNASESENGGPIDVNLTPAVGCFIYKGWAVNLTAGSVLYRYSDMNGTKSSSVSYTIGSYSIGFSKNFTRKVKNKVG